MAASLVMTWWSSSKTRLVKSAARRYGNLPGRIHPLRKSNSAAVILADSYERRVVGGDTLYIAMMMESMPQAKRPSHASTKHCERMSSLPHTSTIPETVLQYERQLRTFRSSITTSPLGTGNFQPDIIHQDDHLIVVNKPSGLLTVPGARNKHSLLTWIHDNLDQAHISHPDHRIVHRLDMDTSGVVVFGKSLDAVRDLQEQFRSRQVEKSYEALLCGHVHSTETTIHIDLPLQRDHEHPPFMRVATSQSEHELGHAIRDLQQNGYPKLVHKRPKSCQTICRVIAKESLYGLPVTRVELTPQTGRTHQLRVHCAAMGNPIVGDPVYSVPPGGKKAAAHPNGGFTEEEMNEMAPHRATKQLLMEMNSSMSLYNRTMCLHARLLRLRHPITQDPVVWRAPTPF